MQFATCRTLLQRRTSSCASAGVAVAVSSLQLTQHQNFSSSCGCSSSSSSSNNNSHNCKNGISRFGSCSSSSSSNINTIPLPTIPSCATAIRTTVQEVRAGDWLCANCGENNFRFRTNCNLCSKPRSGTSIASGGQTIGDVLSTPAPGLESSSSSFARAEGKQDGKRQQQGGERTAIGDWQCPVCQCLNFKFRSECFSCREARPASERPPKGMELTEANMKPGDWKCSECAAINFRGRNSCFTCRCPRSPSAMVAGGVNATASPVGSGRRNSPIAIGGGGGVDGGRPKRGNATSMKPGDWICQSCSELNFADRPACFRCGNPRGDAKGYQPSGVSPSSASSGGNAGLSDTVLEGDWMCPDCGTNNFRRRGTCVKCKKPKPQAQKKPVPEEEAPKRNQDDKLADPVDDL